VGVTGNAAGGISGAGRGICRSGYVLAGMARRKGRRGPGTGSAVRIGLVLFAVLVTDLGAGAYADAQHGAGEGFQVAVRCPG